MAAAANITRRHLFKSVPPALAVAATVAIPGCAEVAMADSAMERARHHLAALAHALDELTPDSDGWHFAVGMRRIDVNGFRHGLWSELRTVHYEGNVDQAAAGIAVERHRRSYEHGIRVL